MLLSWRPFFASSLFHFETTSISINFTYVLHAYGSQVCMTSQVTLQSSRPNIQLPTRHHWIYQVYKTGSFLLPCLLILLLPQGSLSQHTAFFILVIHGQSLEDRTLASPSPLKQTVYYFSLPCLTPVDFNFSPISFPCFLA